MTKQNVGDVLWGREDIINGSSLKGFQTNIQLSIFIYRYLNSTHTFPLDVITTQLPVATYGLGTVDKCNLRSGRPSIKRLSLLIINPNERGREREQENGCRHIGHRL